MYLLHNTVYWIHDSDETNHLTEGYVGITNNFERRMGEHGSTYGKVKEVLFEGLSRTEAENKEKELRPTWHIGKNVAPGGQAGYGGKPGRVIGPQSEEHKRKRLQHLAGNDYGKYRAEETVVEGITFRSVYEACEYLATRYNINSFTAYKRLLDGTEMTEGDARKNNGQNQKTRRCVIDGVEYEGQNFAAKELGWTNGKVRTRCLSKNYPKCYFIK